MKFLTFVLILLTVVVSCNGEPRKYEDFFSLAPYVRENKFKSMSFEQQYDIYIYAMTSRHHHPRDLYYAEELARKGKLVIPDLINKLKSTNSERDQSLIFYVFEMMAIHNNYNINSDENLMPYLKEFPLHMKDSYYKEKVNGSLSTIAGNPK